MSDITRDHNSEQAKGGFAGAQIDVPSSLREQLGAFRKFVWSRKVGEAVALSVVGVLLSFLVVYGVDRFIDTPPLARGALFVVSLALWLAIPRALHRWVWKNRRLDQLARLLRVREPAVGDQLLSVIELAEDTSEQERSHTLCAAAIRQVADSAKGRDFRAAAPPNRLRGLLLTLGIAGLVTAVLWGLFPSAASNAWARYSSPWSSTPRYTFTVLNPLPETMVVPHGESVEFSFSLDEDSPWRPDSATCQLGALPPIEADLVDGTYTCVLPAQIQEVSCTLRCGDFSQVIGIIPKQRPRLVAVSADVQLPAYLQLPRPMDVDVRGGRLAAVEGSVATIHATASAPLKSATVSGQAVTVQNDRMSSSSMAVESDAPLVELQWTDLDDLRGKRPFEITLEALPDAFPSILSQGLPRQDVVLNTQQINFEALASDDFGVRRVGMSWRSLDEDVLSSSASGERVLGAGTPQQTSIQLPGVFCAADLGIEPQPIEVSLWVEDYHPSGRREVSAPHVLYVLTAAQHAAWISDQLGKWQRAALDVRDKELQLFDANKQLRRRVLENPTSDGLREAIRTQASLEAANGRQLAALSKTGEGLLRQASRNSEIGVDQLERWAEMLQTLNDISSNRMPNVSELLNKAAKAKDGKSGGSKAKNSPPMAGQIKDTATGSGSGSSPEDQDEQEQPVVPAVVDRESSMQNPESGDEEQTPEKKTGKPSGAKQGLAGTTLTGPPPPPSDPQSQEPAEETEEPMDEALFEQEQLLAEFEKVADELNDVLANMEGSTLVKRLKAASREQSQVAGKLATRINALFGASKTTSDDSEMLDGLSSRELESTQNVSFIMDDMQAYFERRRIPEFQAVLDDMKELDVLDALENLAGDLQKESGLSIAQAEYWADNLDRWAEDLVPAASGGGDSPPSGGQADSLPPAVILEVLRILEGEVNLRESTRVAEGARASVADDVHMAETTRLADTQSQLRDRIDTVVDQVSEMPKANQRFGKDIELLMSVGMVMGEATQLLRRPETGSNTIAAQTEIIELLLKSQRVNPKSDGGGTGTSPGGGGTGDTEASALTLLGSGLNPNERREARDVTQATGETGRVLPEEFRGGLDAYFSRLEESQPE
ncbi:MAG: hypothetical protein Aurels2KO_31550 [Aureliella sp.]